MGFLLKHHSGKGPQFTIRGEFHDFSRVVTETSWTCFWGLREVPSPRESQGAPQDCSEVAAGAEVLIWS